MRRDRSRLLESARTKTSSASVHADWVCNSESDEETSNEIKQSNALAHFFSDEILGSEDEEQHRIDEEVSDTYSAIAVDCLGRGPLSLRTEYLR